MNAVAQPDAAQSACNKPQDAGAATHTVEIDSLTREYVLVVPETYDGQTPAPAVLTFHGSGSNPGQQLDISELPEAAGARGYVVIAPLAATPREAGGFTWNIPPEAGRPDDVAFTRAVLDDAAEKLCLDQRRVYATGFSGGARLSSTLACDLGDRITAIGAVGGLRHPAECAAERTVPIIAFHGTADPVNPYDGGGPEYWGEGVDTAFQGWGGEYLAGEQEQQAVSGTVTRLAYRDAEDRDLVVLYRIEGAGHVWPGSGYEFPADILGPSSDAVDATGLMLDFFEQYRLPEDRPPATR